MMLPSQNGDGNISRLKTEHSTNSTREKLIMMSLVHSTVRPYRMTIIEQALMYIAIAAVLVLSSYITYILYGKSVNLQVLKNVKKQVLQSVKKQVLQSVKKQVLKSVKKPVFQLHMTEDKSNSSSCILPDYDPLDPSIRKFLFDWNPIVCGRMQPYLTYVDRDGYIHMNQSGIEETGLSAQYFKCQYFEIVRRDGTDNEVDLMISKMFQSNDTLSSPYVLVKCMTGKGILVYETGHAYVPNPTPEMLENNKKLKPERPSVLIIGLDAMSRLNFVRQLPKTYKFLTETLHATVFKGMTKVGDNTYQNILTMLTGMAAGKKEGITAKVWGNEHEHGFFDDLPLAWKQYSKEGYITMFAEDHPFLTAFNYNARGFLKIPTDYYARPFWLAMARIKNFRSSDDRCYGNIPQHMYLFNYTDEFVSKMRNLKYFAFSFLTGLSHDCINSVQVGDADLEAMIRGMHERGDLHNTLFLVMGDHGSRFDEFRGTVMGRMEDRMPFLGVVLPTSLQHLYQGMQANQNTLLSWYDVYEMVMDIAMDNLRPESRVKHWGDVGYSLFRPVPRNRTCLEAGIPKEYCVCLQEHQLHVNQPSVKSLAQELVHHVNALLGASTLSLCSSLTLAHVESAQLLLLPNAHLARSSVAMYRVPVKVLPSSGLLEGTLELDEQSNTSRVIGDVNRINKYGNQSHCIRDKILQLYCYCKDLLHSS